MGKELPHQCIKAAEILEGFGLPENPESLIPQHVIARARGIAVLRVIRAGFNFSGQIGSGLVLARMPDDTWSPPSVIKIAGLGVAEITDVVMILNDDTAVAAFMKNQFKLSGNLMAVAGPSGHTANISVGSVYAPIFTYSKTKGLIAGASFDGSVIIEGAAENANFYGTKVTANDVLNGNVPRPLVADTLYSILHRTISFESSLTDHAAARRQIPQQYQKPQYNEHKSGMLMDDAQLSRQITESMQQQAPPSYGEISKSNNNNNNNLSPQNTIRSKISASLNASPNRNGSSSMPTNPNEKSQTQKISNVTREKLANSLSSSSEVMEPPARINKQSTITTRPLPDLPAMAVDPDETMYCRALYDYTSAQFGDLQFRKGDLIRVLKRNPDGWWYGAFEKREGMFPSTYVSQD
ncbi:hypothetical protein HK100_000487 [Physocladia obscura]|uniref:SH3 domain-containing protein n=1 Tax=Physocladia obscura TaxID=109957 RepID=A0AAD5XIJ9_9FUNG|nr:hypothetical protein HK100_000487 [Physocladia obscura]